MKLTEKDAAFLVTLKRLVDERHLRIEIKDTGHKYLVLRQNYGDRIEAAFGISRQGVRWRFQRLFSHVYVEAYSTILWVESNFGTELRSMAMAIARDRAERRRKALDRNAPMLKHARDGGNRG